MRDGISVLLKLKHQLFGINKVFRTAQRDNIDPIFSHFEHQYTWPFMRYFPNSELTNSARLNT